MGHFTYIRGWVECDEDDVSAIKTVISNYVKKNEKYFMNKDLCELYNKGWRFPDEIINWTAYIFYGADVRSYNVNYIKIRLSIYLKSIKKLMDYFMSMMKTKKI